MELYVTPACTIEAVTEGCEFGWTPIDWSTLISNVLISVGLTIASNRV